MSACLFLVIMLTIKLIYDGILAKIETVQRKKPLPKEVSDIYDADRYNKFIAYSSDKKNLYFIESILSLIIDVAIIYSPFYKMIEQKCDGIYALTLWTFLILTILAFIIKIPFDYYDVFTLETKYELNKKDLKEFIKDEAISLIFGTTIISGLFALAVYFGENISKWTNNFTVEWTGTLKVCAIVLAIAFLIYVLLQFISLFVIRLIYKFTPMPEGELKSEILNLLGKLQKKIKAINVYNESKKSVKKNAFLMKLLFYKEFGIADNFMNENSHRELLAVLSHEIGHLKHKKNILNYIVWGTIALAIATFTFLLHDPKIIFAINEWTKASFGLTKNNYYLYFLIYTNIIVPLFFIFSTFDNYRSRQEEYEADREAIKNGYGSEMITTFKTISNEELINVNPHPLIEFLNYNHPGMYNRIKAIEEGISKIKE